MEIVRRIDVDSRIPASEQVIYSCQAQKSFYKYLFGQYMSKGFGLFTFFICLSVGFGLPLWYQKDYESYSDIFSNLFPWFYDNIRITGLVVILILLAYVAIILFIKALISVKKYKTFFTDKGIYLVTATNLMKSSKPIILPYDKIKSVQKYQNLKMMKWNFINLILLPNDNIALMYFIFGLSPADADAVMALIKKMNPQVSFN